MKHCNAKNGCIHENDENTTYCEGINCTALILGHEFSELKTAPSKNPARTPQDIQPNDGGSTPSQYGIPEDAKDLQDLIEVRNMNFAIGNIFKACYRLGLKNAKIYDLNKIKWFIDREIERTTK